MSTMKITEQGRAIIANSFTSGNAGGAKYWVGYYGLAYVDRSDEAESLDKVTTKLTQKGDYIYNIWQGDLTNVGFAENDNSGAKTLFGLTMYDKNICSNYRYVMDSEGRNNLVAWSSSGTNGAEDVAHRESYMVYRGYDVDTQEASNIPVPAPLFYYNDPLGADETLSSPGGITEAEFDANLGAKNGVYSDLPHNGTDLPLVSDDARYYTGAKPGEDISEFAQPITISDNGKWIASDFTRRNNPSGLSKVYAKLRSISNYNLLHGNVSSEGYSMSSISACHNMSKATKLFPISAYQVLVDGAGAGGNPETVDNTTNSASSVKFSISLSPITRDRTYLDVIDNISADSSCDVTDEEDVNLFDTKKNRFKFNRIGIYAVQMEVRRFAEMADANTCSADHVQFEIINDSDPVLFAVADINETIVSDSGNGSSRIDLDFVLNMGDDGDSQLIKDSGIFYNLYENSAITWYENQLLASAGLSEAVTSIGIDVANLRRQIGKMNNKCETSATVSADMSQYAKVNHSHAFMKHLVDGTTTIGAVHGIDSVVDGYTDETTGAVYNLGSYSVALGSNTMAAGAYSIVQGKDIDASGDGTFAVGADGSTVAGEGNAVIGAASAVRIEGGTTKYNTVTAVDGNGTVHLSNSSTGNVVFGMDITDGTYDISRSHENIIFGKTGKKSAAGKPTIDGAFRSIIGLDGDFDVGSGIVDAVSDSMLLGVHGIAKNVSDSILVSGSHAIGKTEHVTIVGDVHDHSVQFTEVTEEDVAVPGTTSDKTTIENTVVFSVDSDTVTKNSIWVGDGEQYGSVVGSSISGETNAIGEWHLYDYDSTVTTHLTRSAVKGLSVAGNSNNVGNGTTSTIVVGDGNSIGKHAGSIVIGSNNNTVYDKMDEYASGEEFNTVYPTTTPVLGKPMWIHATENGRIYDGGTSYVLYEGTTVAYAIEGGLRWFNKEHLDSHNSPLGSAWGFDHAVYGSVKPSNVSGSVFIGSGNNWGSNTVDSMLFGSSNDLRYCALDNSTVIASGLVVAAPSSDSATEYVQKSLKNVRLLGGSSSVISAIGQFNNAPEKSYSDALIFSNLTVDADSVTDVANVLGIGNTYNGGDFSYGTRSGRSVYTARPRMSWGDDGVAVWTDSLNSDNMDITSTINIYGDAVYAQRKPDAAMIYSDGLALLGTATCRTGGLLKLGSSFASVSYISTYTTDLIGTYSGWSTDSWSNEFIGSKRGDIFDVKLTPGTRQSPYAGRTLVVDHAQELDGTLHIKLGGYAAEDNLMLAIANGKMGTLDPVSGASDYSNIEDHGVYTFNVVENKTYLGVPKCAGIVARVYFTGETVKVSDLMVKLDGNTLNFHEGSYIGDKTALDGAGWLRLISVPTDSIDATDVTVDAVPKYAWCSEKI